MKAAIHRYPIKIVSRQVINLPKAAILLRVSQVNAEISLWAFINPEAEKELRVIRMIATGEEFNTEELKPNYIGTIEVDNITVPNRKLIWHVFEGI